MALGVLCKRESVQAHERTLAHLLLTQHVQGNYGLGVREGPGTSPWGIKGTVCGIQ